MKQMEYKEHGEFEILGTGTIKGIDWAIISHGTHPCAYIKVTRENRERIAKMAKPAPCHGGITYMENKLDGLDDAGDGTWVGWDYSHMGDFLGFYIPIGAENGKRWTTDEIMQDIIKMVDWALTGYNDK